MRPRSATDNNNFGGNRTSCLVSRHEWDSMGTSTDLETLRSLTTKPLLKGPDHCDLDPMCLNARGISLLKNIRTGLIDPDTPKSAMKITSSEGKEWDRLFDVRCNVS